jgi:hypothetical protein
MTYLVAIDATPDEVCLGVRVGEFVSAVYPREFLLEPLILIPEFGI